MELTEFLDGIKVRVIDYLRKACRPGSSGNRNQGGLISHQHRQHLMWARVVYIVDEDVDDM